MKLGIAGCGAMGSIFSYYFHKMNYTTSIYEINRDTVSALKEGLHVQIEKKVEIVNPEISDSAGFSEMESVCLILDSALNPYMPLRSLLSSITILSAVLNPLKPEISVKLVESEIFSAPTSFRELNPASSVTP